MPCDLLTKQEMKIARLVSKGMTNADISWRIGATVNMVKNHLRVVYDKTGMGSRLELALWYVVKHERKTT